MSEFIANGVVWMLAIYGLLEIIKTVIRVFSYSNLRSNGIYFIIAAKNQEEKIEGFIRSILFRILYGKEEIMNDIIVVDLESTDNTKEIIEKMAKDYEFLKVSDWKECKEIVDKIAVKKVKK